MVLSGHSWSGNERNCCFLNLGGSGASRFANISAAAGLDLIGDGRALATTDWDQDGDLDLWLTNRTGPRVQMLRNDSSTGHHFLAVRLEGNGRTSNRDAIGARVEVVLSEQLSGGRYDQENPKSKIRNPKSIKTLRAGEGYLSQSGKWIHFGLGSATEVEKVIVRWPDGGIQEYTDIVSDRFYRIVQDVEMAQMWSVRRPAVALTSTSVSAPCAGAQANLALSSPMPLPSLNYETFDGEKALLRDLRGRPVVVCLWASWCAPCLVELAELAKRENEIRAAGLEVLALSVDGLGDGKTKPGAARQALANSKFPFRTGRATTELVDKMHIAHQNLFNRPQDLPVPTSLLIDPEGRLAAVYRGRVEVERLVADTETLSQPNAGPQFAGRWISRTPEQTLSLLVGELFSRGYTSEAIEYMTDNDVRLREEKDYEKLLNKAATEHMKQDEMRTASILFQEALDLNPDYLPSLNNLAWIMATDSDESLRDGAKAVEYAQRAVAVAGNREPDVIGTLAASYAEAGRFEEAVATAEQAIRLAHEMGADRIGEGLRKEIALYWNGQPVRME
jgi:peroxiredoxin